MTNPEKIKQTLLSEIEKMDQRHEDFCRHPGIDFTRDRKIAFDAGTPSLSAFCQQRAKLSDDVFQKLFYNFNNCFKPKSLLKGRYQLLACDGSGFTFTRNPKDTESYYDPRGRSQKGYNQIYLVPLYDLLNKVYTDAIIQPMRKRNEFAALYELIDRHPPCNGTVPIFIADRGFHACNVFAHAIENRAFFVIRATDAKMKRLLGTDLPKEETFDIRMTRYLTRSLSKKKYLHHDLAGHYRYICKRWLLTISRLKGMGNTKYPCASCVSPLGTAPVRTS